ncbi:YetF domain-containing protein [Bacillus sp. V59.32b]|uniref:YetF domain-containing protein n=1 Tax=Bacillus sp. V59.32b TaxID=1758642 RepID=UPI000E3EAFCC|nr:YetF domain-containing protein [Bacillus sp. V59.32b]RFU64213.1 DUF421 domain-containing protein [Bacillus sp. V59.32b]
MESILTTSLRTLIGFFLLLFLTRILGKKQISQLTFFTYITGIALGNIAGDMVVHRDIKIIDGVTGLSLWTVFDYAILEPNGQLSVLKKEEHESTIRKDFHIQTIPRLYLPTELVVDGKAIPRNLAELNKSETWLINQLQMKGIKSMDEILYAELQADGTIHIDKKK